ncbi:MAG: hypothetical protein HQL55_20370, partial [Magnetococcales bacterium]|nr:hypothetical protein [Magnetococcales bacterium]
MMCNAEKVADVEDRTQTRQRLKAEKPLLYEKFLYLDELAKRGEPPPPVVEIAYRYACNLKCKHCFASQFTVKDRSLQITDLI